jgi:hypothetical protein
MPNFTPTSPARPTEITIGGVLISKDNKVPVTTETSQAFIGDDGEQFTRDVQLAQLFGSMPLVTNSRLQTQTNATETVVRGCLGVLGQELRVACNGCPTVGVQITGTFTGTILWEGTVDGGTWVAISAVTPSGGLPVASTTVIGAWRLNATGMQSVRLRASAAIVGAALCTFLVSSVPSDPSPSQVFGSLAALSQRATSYELNTYDTNLAAVLGIVSLIRAIYDTPVGPATPAVMTAAQLLLAPTRFSSSPQIFPRLRVEAAGDQKLPLSQRPATNELRVASDELYRLLESVNIQLSALNSAFVASGFTLDGWEPVR